LAKKSIPILAKNKTPILAKNYPSHGSKKFTGV